MVVTAGLVSSKDTTQLGVPAVGTRLAVKTMPASFLQVRVDYHNLVPYTR
jgi:hypothetical protein